MPSPTVYSYRIAFDAPLRFVFRWCTDYRPTDARLEAEQYQRRVLERGPRRVVYEDLEATADGWFWSRHVVRLSPPDRWHSASIGNYRRFELDYRLKELPGGRTEMRFEGRRWPFGLARRNPSPAAFRRSMDHAWRRFRRHLEQEYRRSRPRARRPGQARSRT